VEKPIEGVSEARGLAASYEDEKFLQGKVRLFDGTGG
jgi:hypothetical protein